MALRCNLLPVNMLVCNLRTEMAGDYEKSEGGSAEWAFFFVFLVQFLQLTLLL